MVERKQGEVAVCILDRYPFLLDTASLISNLESEPQELFSRLIVSSAFVETASKLERFLRENTGKGVSREFKGAFSSALSNDLFEIFARERIQPDEILLSHDQTVHLWHIASNKPILYDHFFISGVADIVSSDGIILAKNGEVTCISGLCEYTLRDKSLKKNFKKRRQLRNFTQGLVDGLFDVDSDRLYTISKYLSSIHPSLSSRLAIDYLHFRTLFVRPQAYLFPSNEITYVPSRRLFYLYLPLLREQFDQVVNGIVGDTSRVVDEQTGLFVQLSNGV
jgi:hypothetical protein